MVLFYDDQLPKINFSFFYELNIFYGDKLLESESCALFEENGDSVLFIKRTI